MEDARSNSNIWINRNRPLRVLVCAITLVAFLFNTISYNLAWAVGAPSELPVVGSEKAGSPGLFKDLNVETFILPEYMGYLRDSFKAGSSDKVVIHIQDAHCNYAAQKRIAEIIEYINNEYGVSTINLEGGREDYDLSPFTSIADKDVRERASDYFVKEGLVNGAEYFAVNNPEKVSLWGIENVELYIDNLNVYRNYIKHKDETDKSVKSLSYILTNLKTRIYSKELLEFDAKYLQYKAAAIEFNDYLDYLTEKAKASSIDIKRFNNIYLLSQSLAAESGVDFNKADSQRDILIDKLQKTLSRNALEGLLAKTVEFNMESISRKEFYNYLLKKADSVKIDITEFPAVQKYIAYISLYDAIDKSKIMEETGALENAIRGCLYQNDTQKELATLSKNLALTKNLFGISMTKADYDYYKANEDSFAARNYLKFIEKEAPLYKITAQPDSNVKDLDSYREEMSVFYEYSLKRDDAFIKNIKFFTNHESRTTNDKHATILITGGFHTENLTELFRKQGISYISILPNFTNSEGYECPYYKLLSGENKMRIRETLPSVLNSSIAVASQLNNELDAAVNRPGQVAAVALQVEAAKSVAAKPTIKKKPETKSPELMTQEERNAAGIIEAYHGTTKSDLDVKDVPIHLGTVEQATKRIEWWTKAVTTTELERKLEIAIDVGTHDLELAVKAEQAGDTKALQGRLDIFNGRVTRRIDPSIPAVISTESMRTVLEKAHELLKAEQARKGVVSAPQPTIYRIFLRPKKIIRMEDRPSWDSAIEEARAQGADVIVYRNTYEGEADSYLVLDRDAIIYTSETKPTAAPAAASPTTPPTTTPQASTHWRLGDDMRIDIDFASMRLRQDAGTIILTKKSKGQQAVLADIIEEGWSGLLLIPELARVPIAMEPASEGPIKYWGAMVYKSKNGETVVAFNEDFVLKRDGSLSSVIRSDLVHELVHIVADIKGYAPGGNPYVEARRGQRGRDAKVALVLRDIMRRDSISADEAAKKLKDEWKEDISQGAIDLARSGEPDTVLTGWVKDGLISPMEAEKRYKLLQDEAIARMEQRRLDMTPEQRKAESPYEALTKMLLKENLLKPGQIPENVLIDLRKESPMAPKIVPKPAVVTPVSKPAPVTAPAPAAAPAAAVIPAVEKPISFNDAKIKSLIEDIYINFKKLRRQNQLGNAKADYASSVILKFLKDEYGIRADEFAVFDSPVIGQGFPRASVTIFGVELGTVEKDPAHDEVSARGAYRYVIETTNIDTGKVKAIILAATKQNNVPPLFAPATPAMGAVSAPTLAPTTTPISNSSNIVGAMHEGELNPAGRLEAMRRLLRIKGIDIEEWANEQADNMKAWRKNTLREALVSMGLTSEQIEDVIDKIILVNVPENIRLEGRTSRLGGLIIRTKNGYRILVPEERITGSLQSKEYLADLLHEAVELQLLGTLSADEAHARAIEARDRFLGKDNGLGDEFDAIMVEQLKREKFFRDSMPYFTKAVLERLEMQTVDLIDNAPAGGRVYHVRSKEGDRYLVFVDDTDNVIGLAYYTGSGNNFGTVDMGKSGIGDKYNLLPPGVYGLFNKKLHPLIKLAGEGKYKIEDRRLEFGSIRYTDKLKGKIFLPAVNTYYGLNEIRGDFINNSIIRHLVRLLGSKIILSFSETIRFVIDDYYKNASGISMGGQTWYDMHHQGTRNSFMLYFIGVVAHEFTHEFFRTLKEEQLKLLREHFLSSSRTDLANVIKSNPAYTRNAGDHLMTEMIAFIVGRLVEGNITVNLQDALLNMSTTPILLSDIDALLKCGILPAEFEATADERIRMDVNGGKIDLEYLARVYPQAVNRLEIARDRTQREEKIVGAMHELILDGDRKPSPAAAPQKGSGSWFGNEAWVRNAWWSETTISFGLGALVFGMLTLFGLNDYASLMGFALAPPAIFAVGHVFNPAYDKSIVAKLTVAKVFIGGIVVALGLWNIWFAPVAIALAIPLAFYHKGLNLSESVVAPAAPAAAPQVPEIPREVIDLRRDLEGTDGQWVRVQGPSGDVFARAIYTYRGKFIHVFVGSYAPEHATVFDSANMALGNMGGLFVPTTKIESFRMSDGNMRTIYVEDALEPLVSTHYDDKGSRIVDRGGWLAKLYSSDPEAAKRVIDEYLASLEEMWDRGIFNTDAKLINLGVYKNGEKAGVYYFDLGSYRRLHDPRLIADFRILLNVIKFKNEECLAIVEPSLRDYFVEAVERAKFKGAFDPDRVWRKLSAAEGKARKNSVPYASPIEGVPLQTAMAALVLIREGRMDEAVKLLKPLGSYYGISLMELKLQAEWIELYEGMAKPIAKALGIQETPYLKFENTMSGTFANTDSSGINILKWFVEQYYDGKITKSAMALIIAHELSHIKNGAAVDLGTEAERENEIRDTLQAVDLVVGLGYGWSEAAEFLNDIVSIKQKGQEAGAISRYDPVADEALHSYKKIVAAIYAKYSPRATPPVVTAQPIQRWDEFRQNAERIYAAWSNGETLAEPPAGYCVSPEGGYGGYSATGQRVDLPTIFSGEIAKLRDLGIDNYGYRADYLFYTILMQGLLLNIKQHGGGTGKFVLFFDKDKMRVYFAVMDKGTGREEDRLELNNEGRFVKKGPGMGDAWKIILRNASAINVYQRGKMFVKDNELMKEMVGGSPYDFNGALVVAEFDLKNFKKPKLTPTPALPAPVAPIVPIEAGVQAGAAKVVVGDLAQGKTDIVIMPGSDIYYPQQTAMGKDVSAKLRKDYGHDTLPYNYKFGEKWLEGLVGEAGSEDRSVLGKAIEALNDSIKNRENDPRIVIFVPSESVNNVKEIVSQRYPGAKDRISVIGELDSIPANGVVDTVMHIVLGKGLLNYQRYQEKLEPEVKDRLVNFIKTLVANPEEMTPAILDDLLKGIKYLRIRPVDFKEIEDWKRSQDEVLRAL